MCLRGRGAQIIFQEWLRPPLLAVGKAVERQFLASSDCLTIGAEISGWKG